LRERGRIVYAVAGHGRDEAAALHLTYFGDFLVRQNFDARRADAQRWPKI
jgi:hypothetical protein